jgi:hypothetical protein
VEPIACASTISKSVFLAKMRAIDSLNRQLQQTMRTFVPLSTKQPSSLRVICDLCFSKY